MNTRIFAVVLFLIMTLSTVACSSHSNRPKYDPSIEPFGYVSSAGSSSMSRFGHKSIGEMHADGITNTVLVITPVSDFADRKQVEGTVMPRWQGMVAPCEVIAVIKNDPGVYAGPFIEAGEIINIMEGMHFYEGEDGNVTLYRHEVNFFPLQKGQPYLWFGASGSLEHGIEGLGHLYWPASYGAFDISQRELTNYEAKAMQAPDKASNQGEYAEALVRFTQFKKEASESDVFSPYFDEFAKQISSPDTPEQWSMLSGGYNEKDNNINSYVINFYSRMHSNRLRFCANFHPNPYCKC